jgi:hypothetical protein
MATWSSEGGRRASVEASLVRGLEEGALAEEIARLQHDEQDEYALAVATEKTSGVEPVASRS